MIQRDDEERLALIRHRLSLLPSLLKRDPGSSSLYVDADTIVEDRDGICQYLFRSRECGGSELRIEQRRQEAGGIVWRRFDEQIEVESDTRDAVQHRGNAADDHVLHLMLLKGREHVPVSIE